MAKLVHQCSFGTITEIVLERLFPNERISIKPDELPNWIAPYGNLVSPSNNHSYRLLGVRFTDSRPGSYSYAGCYWYCSPWTSWHLYIGASHSPGLKVER